MSGTLTRLEAAPDLVERVYETLLDAISDGSLAAGVRLAQDEIAERLSVSRQPVLQALRLLKKDGFVEDAPGRGVRVAALGAREVAQIYEVRGVLEGLAAQLAARARVAIDPALIERGRRALISADVGELIDADLAFHRAIYAASGNPLIGQTGAMHWRHLRRAMGASLTPEDGPRRTVWDEHEAIARAIAAGDAPLAQRLAHEHCTRAGAEMAARLQHAQERPSAAGDSR